MRDRLGLPDRVKLPFAFDPALLARDLAALGPAEWIDHFLTERYEGQWDVIPLRGPAECAASRDDDRDHARPESL